MNSSRVTAMGSAPYDSESLESLNNGTMTVSEFLLNALGPQQMPLQWLVPVTIFYALVFITGLVGNIAVCIVIVRNKNLHSAMKFYLISLAIADLSIIILGRSGQGFSSQLVEL